MKLKVIKTYNLFEIISINQIPRKDIIILYSFSLTFNSSKKKYNLIESNKLDNMNLKNISCIIETYS